jgi:hypothetical protein
LSCIGQGATSTVYRAYQPRLDRLVAIKVLSPLVVGEEGFLDRFVQEARAVAQLDHPNIVPVYDFDQVDDIAYIVFKYIGGGTLRDRMKGSPMELGFAVDIIAQIGMALDYAHQHGVLHRDVKPGNILISEGRWALLTDFGLAKILSGGRQLTRSGILVGTPDYISPELAQGMPSDGRSDVYSLGATLYEMLTGRKPFDAEGSIGVVIKHIAESAPSLREFSPDLPQTIENVVLTALAKKPTERFQTARAMTSALVRAAGPVLEHATAGTVEPIGTSIVRLAEPEPALQNVMWTRVRQMSEQVRLAGSQMWQRVTGISQQVPLATWIQLAQRRQIKLGGAFLAAFVLLWVGSNALLAGSVNDANPAPATTLAQPAAIATLPATRAPTAPPPTPLLPSATPSPVLPIVTSTPLPEWTFLPSSAPIRPGIWARIVRPDGLDVFQGAGFDQEFVTALGSGKLVYVLQGPVRANALSWIRITDGAVVGWGIQDHVVAYGIRNTP